MPKNIRRPGAWLRLQAGPLLHVLSPAPDPPWTGWWWVVASVRTNQLASARWTASGSLSMTTRRIRAGPSGRRRPCSQLRIELNSKP